MVIVIVCAVCGLFLASKRIQLYLNTRRAVKAALKTKPTLKLLRLSLPSVLMFLLLAGVAASFLVFHLSDPTTTGVCILVILLSIGEMFGAVTMKDFYYDEHGFFYCNRYFGYHQVKQLTAQKGLGMMYGVETDTHDLFSVSKQAYEIIRQHVKS